MAMPCEWIQSGERTLEEFISAAIPAAFYRACHVNEQCELAGFWRGEITGSSADLLRQIDASIGMLKQFRQTVQGLDAHTHQWGEDDYCVICGADGRA
jgi:hypothetical protein